MDTERPVPDELVERLCGLVTWAPNHKRTWPWRFALFRGEGRARLGEAFAADQLAAGRSPGDPKVAKTRVKYLRAPVVLVVGSGPDPHPDVRRENRDATSAGIQNLLLGATAAGLASFWSSPPARRGQAARRVCAFEKGTQLVGVVYLGWPAGQVSAPARPPLHITRVE
jgi:nitroreductase